MRISIIPNVRLGQEEAATAEMHTSRAFQVSRVVAAETPPEVEAGLTRRERLSALHKSEGYALGSEVIAKTTRG